MPNLVTYVDAEAAVRAWINANLSGLNAPLPKGAQFRQLRSPYKGAYALISQVNVSTQSGTGDFAFMRSTISAQVYGLSKENASSAAIQYANAITNVRTKTAMGSVWCEYVTDVTGPIDLSIVDKEPHYSVDADFHLHA